MKKTITVAAALLIIAVAGFVLTTHEGLQSAEIPIAGMSCENCADRIEKTLVQLEGVRTVEVSFSEAMAKVRYDEVLTTLPVIEKKIGELGYRAAQPGEAIAPASDHSSCTSGSTDAPGCCMSKPQKSST